MPENMRMVINAGRQPVTLNTAWRYVHLYGFQKPPHNKLLRRDLCPFGAGGVGGLGLDGDFGAVG